MSRDDSDKNQLSCLCCSLNTVSHTALIQAEGGRQCCPGASLYLSTNEQSFKMIVRTCPRPRDSLAEVRLIDQAERASCAPGSLELRNDQHLNIARTELRHTV